MATRTTGSARGEAEKEVDRWYINDDDRWVHEPESGYRTKEENQVNCPKGMEKLWDWMLDMQDWGDMVQDEIKKLRRRVKYLENRAGVPQSVAEDGAVTNARRSSARSAAP